MSNDTSNESLGPQTETLQQPQGGANSVKIKNNIQNDVMIYLHNDFWGAASLGYVRAGQDIDMPASVNVDAYAMFMNGQGIFMRWPGPVITCTRKKINLTPGQTYSLSDFDRCG